MGISKSDDGLQNLCEILWVLTHDVLRWICVQHYSQQINASLSY